MNQSQDLAARLLLDAQINIALEKGDHETLRKIATGEFDLFSVVDHEEQNKMQCNIPYSELKGRRVRIKCNDPQLEKTESRVGNLVGIKMHWCLGFALVRNDEGRLLLARHCDYLEVAQDDGNFSNPMVIEYCP